MGRVPGGKRGQFWPQSGLQSKGQTQFLGSHGSPMPLKSKEKKGQRVQRDGCGSRKWARVEHVLRPGRKGPSKPTKLEKNIRR